MCRPRVQEVAEEHDVRDVVNGHQGVQRCQVLAGGPARHRHALRAERGRLAEVDIGHHQHPAGRPVQRLLGQQQHAFAGDEDFARAHGCAAFSSSRTMRATRSDSFSVVTFSRKRSTIRAKPNGVARLTSR